MWKLILEYIHEERDAGKLFGNVTLLNIDCYFQMECI